MLNVYDSFKIFIQSTIEKEIPRIQNVWTNNINVQVCTEVNIIMNQGRWHNSRHVEVVSISMDFMKNSKMFT